MAAFRCWDKTMKKPLMQFAKFVWNHKLVSISIAILVVVISSAIFLSLLAPFDPYAINVKMANMPPGTPSFDGSGTHLLGTDALGRDLLSRIMLGSRVSLSVGVVSVILSGTLGTFIGLIAGYYRGVTDTVMMRVVDLQMSIPSLLAALLVLYVLGPSFMNVVLVLSITRWMIYARVTRGLTLSLREELFIESARALGSSDKRIMIRHLIPNLAAPILVLATLDLAIVMLTEASLSFLGLGIQPPNTSWGLMISEGREYLRSSWWLVAMPGFAILFTTLSVNIIATWLRAKTVKSNSQRASAPKEASK
jgi:peptide/nickel transport system permease protein